MTAPTNEFRVMTSGAFTAAHLSLVPLVEQLTGLKVVTVTRSIGTGEMSIPSRLKRGEIADIVIVAEPVLRQFIADGLVLDEGKAILAQSLVAMAVRAGAAKPDISSPEAMKATLLKAASIGYSASESGKYYTGQLVHRLGIAEQVLPKSRMIGGGERVGAVIARGELELGFQQLSELLPVEGIAHITPLPPSLQMVSSYMAGVAAKSPQPEVARKVIALLASREAAAAVRASGLEPASA